VNDCQLDLDSAEVVTLDFIGIGNFLRLIEVINRWIITGNFAQYDMATYGQQLSSARMYPSLLSQP